jgi:hypothetical protein
MKTQGNITDISIDYSTGRPKLTITLTEKHLEAVETIKDKLLDIELKVHRRKRSLDSNAYCWKLIDEIAEKTGIAKEEIYRETIRNIGGNNVFVCVINKALDTLVEEWSRKGLGYIAETFPSKLEGCTNVTLYYGSSSYDSAQMHRLIQLLEEEARQQGIPLMASAEVEKMIKEWR